MSSYRERNRLEDLDSIDDYIEKHGYIETYKTIFGIEDLVELVEIELERRLSDIPDLWGVINTLGISSWEPNDPDPPVD